MDRTSHQEWSTRGFPNTTDRHQDYGSLQGYTALEYTELPQNTTTNVQSQSSSISRYSQGEVVPGSIQPEMSTTSELICSFHLRNLVLGMFEGIETHYLNSPNEGYSVYGVCLDTQTMDLKSVLYVVVRERYPQRSMVISRIDPIVCIQIVKEYTPSLPTTEAILDWGKVRRTKYVKTRRESNWCEFSGPEETRLRLYNNPKKRGLDQYPDHVYLPVMMEVPKAVLNFCHS